MQRGMSASSKLSRSAGTTTAYGLSSQKRTSEKGRSGPTLVGAISIYDSACRLITKFALLRFVSPYFIFVD